MGYPENNRTVRGDRGTLSTNATGTIQTDNYTAGGAFQVGDGETAYPRTIDPADATIQELVITETGMNIRADMVTASGDTLENVALRGQSLASDTLSLDRITLKDPDGTGAATFGYWSGE